MYMFMHMYMLYNMHMSHVMWCAAMCTCTCRVAHTFSVHMLHMLDAV